MTKKKINRKMILSCVGLVLVLMLIYSGLRILEPAVLAREPITSETVPSKTIVRNGTEFFPRQDITVVMVLGIDQFGPVQSSDFYKNSGCADMVMLLIFDEKNEACTVLQINRDTMLDIPAMGVFGEDAGTYYGQLALAHTYGSGMEDSSENVKKALEKLLPGATIDYYVTMHMDAIPILNDAIGGVTVTVVDDFSDINPSISKGTQTLMGNQVLDYVRTRKGVGDQKNTTRMARQREYVSAFLERLSEKGQEDHNFLTNLYGEVSPYIVTDCSTNTISRIMDLYREYEIREIVSPEGESVIVDGYYEFHTDKEKLDDLIVRLFYAPKYS